MEGNDGKRRTPGKEGMVHILFRPTPPLPFPPSFLFSFFHQVLWLRATHFRDGLRWPSERGSRFVCDFSLLLEWLPLLSFRNIHRHSLPAFRRPVFLFRFLHRQTEEGR